MEKSPKAEQYYRLLSTHPILSFRAKRGISWKGHRFVVKFALQVKFSRGKWSLSMTSEVSPKVKLWWKKYIFLCLSLFVPQVRGSLDYARDDGIFLYCHSERKRSMSFRGHSMPEETPGKGLSPGKDTDLWWSLLCKWSFPTESEVSPKVKLRWESIQFLFTP